MAGAGIEVKIDSEYKTIIEALRKASMPALAEIAHSGGLALKNITNEAFAKKADPATGTKWASKKDGSEATLFQHGTLKKSVRVQAFSDGSVVLGSNMVYARIHQEGGTTRAHEIKPRHKNALSFNGICRKLVHHPGSRIPARPYLGVPADFERQFFSDPAILKLLGVAAGGGV